jgi:hypothetical protein
MSGVVAWVASSGVVQGVIIGAALAFLTSILILEWVAKAQTTTVNGWRSIHRAGQPGTGLLVRAALQKALPVVNVFEEAAYWTSRIDSAGSKLARRLACEPGLGWVEAPAEPPRSASLRPSPLSSWLGLTRLPPTTPASRTRPSRTTGRTRG